jgi:H+/Cl- antiporter ClcA
LTGSAVASAAALLGLAAIYAFPHLHRLFSGIQNPPLMIAAGGVLLGILGIVGGNVTLFKGLDQMKELANTAADYSTWGLAKVSFVKLAALLIAASCGFRGGRVFPSVFIGVALGLLANSLVSGIPPALAVSCALLGFLLAVTRSGWLSLFLAATVVGDVNLLPILCLVILPAWLCVTGRPEMQLKANHNAG